MRDLANRNMARHDLVTVAPDAWATLLAERPDLDGLPFLPDWAERGWPVIIRRRVPGEDVTRIPAGFPLPPSLGKRRIGFALSPAGVTHRPSVTLAEARRAAPAAWHPTIDALIAHGAVHGLVPRVFGGLLWQSLTGLPYLTATSDLDLLWPCPDAIDRAFLDGLGRIEAEASMRLDGELLLADGFDVNWREIHVAGPGDTVLAKALERLELRPVPVATTAPAAA